MGKGIVIGLIGRSRVGKDTFGKMLAEELFNRTGKRFILMAYAEELKKRIQLDFDLSYDQLWGDKKEEEDLRYPKKEGGYWTGREIMQFMGTECFRAVDNNFWIKELFRIVNDNGFKYVIITDVRFPDEAQPVKERDGFIIQVSSNREIVGTVHNQKHASEVSMTNYDKIDFKINNNGSLEELRSTAVQLVDMLLQIKNMEAL